MTRLEQLDAYRFTFDATVTATRESDGGGAWVALDQSAFYPTSGGQLHDTGTLGDAAVTDVSIEQGVVWHRVDAPSSALVPGAGVHGVVDAERRERHRQRHSAQHLLSQAFVRVSEAYATRAVSLLGPDMTLDLAGEPDTHAIAAAERLANQAAYAGWPVVVVTVPDTDLARFPLRRPPKVTGAVRLVAMGPDVRENPAGAWELSACGGTHVANTAEVAPIVVLRSERVRGGLTRLTFRAGWEAWLDHHAKHDAAARTAASLSSGIPELFENVQALQSELADTRRALHEARAQVAHARADAWLADAPEGALLVAELDADEADLMLPLADALAARGATVVLGVVRGDKAELLLASGAGVDVRPALQAGLALLEGRGGGKPERAQGAGPRAEALAAALAAAHDTVAS